MSLNISIIIPCYNEERTIGLLLQAIYGQTHPRRDMEVVIADGMSTDRTRQVIHSFAQAHRDLAIRIVDNPRRAIPAALNRAIESSSGLIVIRLDAHSVPMPDYVERCLEALETTGAANVGGLWEIQPSGSGWMARAIAAAAAHPLGAGDARYRYSLVAGEVDTVPFGAFRREWLQKVGPFNELLLTNEDYEYNVRIRQAGGTIWYDPSIRSAYFARPDLLSLARQYSRYGFWKARMVRRYPASIRLRQALPPIFAGALVLLLAAAPFSILARLLLGLQLGAYALTTGAAGIIEALRRRDAGVGLGFPVALLTMHMAWGLAFLWGLVSAVPGTDSELPAG